MDEGMSIVFAPVTREQARLFGGVARMLDRRGVRCRFAVPSPEIAEELADDWDGLIDTLRTPAASERETQATAVPTDAASSIPPHIGAYDAWRWGWSESTRAESAARALAFWREVLSRHAPRAVILWNGRDHVFVEAAAHVATECSLNPRSRICVPEVLYLELGPLRRSPMTVAIARGGVNAAAQWRRPELLDEPLNPWESERLRRFVSRFRDGIRRSDPAREEGGHDDREAAGYAFLPLQVDDDTQLFYYAPHFGDQREMLAAVVAAMPAGLPLVIKPHPLSDDRLGRARYEPMLRPIDRIAPPASDTLSLIAGARCVITTNSSAGVESLMLDRPVVVLGQAHYRGRGVTSDFSGDMRRALSVADRWKWTVERANRRDRYLYELAFEELVHLEGHPLRNRPSDEEHDRLAVRLLDLLEPLDVGSDWTPVFREAAAMRTRLREALDACAPDPQVVIVASRFAAACISAADDPRVIILEDCSPAASTSCIPTAPGRTEVCASILDRIRGRAVHLLAPDLAPGQRAAFIAQARQGGATDVVDVLHAMSRLRCEHHTARFNQLPAAIRDPLYARGDYWDHYAATIGPAGQAPNPLKQTQAELIAEALGDPPPATLLEYGCGDGVVLAGLRERNPALGESRLAGVDGSARMLDMARRRLRQGGDAAAGRFESLDHAHAARNATAEIAPADARRGPLPFADRAFEAVYTCGALQHVPAAELSPILDELHRVARRRLVHWECFEAHRPAEGEHYTNPGTSRAIHEAVFERAGPVRMSVRDLRPVSGQNSLLTAYELDRPLLTVLTFHAVGRPDPACESLDYRGMFVTADELARIVSVLRQGGWTFLTVGQAQACLRGERPAPRKGVALTFDDGYASVAQECHAILTYLENPNRTEILSLTDIQDYLATREIPELLYNQAIPATVYVATDYIGRGFAGATREGGGAELPMMSEAQIRRLADAGWEIGAHSCSHPVFLNLTREQARREMAESKDRLQQITGRGVTSFAFPYGEPGVAFSADQVELAREVGFETIMSMQPGLVDPHAAGATAGARIPSRTSPAGIPAGARIPSRTPTAGSPSRESAANAHTHPYLWPRIGVGGDVWPEGLPARIAAIHRTTSGWPAPETEPQQVLASRVRRVVRRCVESGRTRVALYGAGRHTARLLAQAPLWPLQVVGLIDDDPSLAGTRRYGMPIYGPADLPRLRAEALVISSDQYEDAIYSRLSPLEAQGVSVHRLYAG